MQERRGSLSICALIIPFYLLFLCFEVYARWCFFYLVVWPHNLDVNV